MRVRDNIDTTRLAGKKPSIRPLGKNEGKFFAGSYREPLQLEHLPRNLCMELSVFRTNGMAFSR